MRMYIGINLVKENADWLHFNSKMFYRLMSISSQVFSYFPYAYTYEFLLGSKLDKMNQSNICIVENLLHKEDIII